MPPSPYEIHALWNARVINRIMIKNMVLISLAKASAMPLEHESWSSPARVIKFTSYWLLYLPEAEENSNHLSFSKDLQTYKVSDTLTDVHRSHCPLG